MSWQEDRKVGEKRGSRQGQGAGSRAPWCVWVGPRCAHLGVKWGFLCCGSYRSREPLARLLWGEVTEVTQGDVGSALIIKGQCLS